MTADFLSSAGTLGRLIECFDWSGTALGPLADWPLPVTTTLGIVLNSSVPMLTLWGEDGIMIYNDAYARLAGGRHPGLLGQPVRQGWSELAGFNDRVMKMVLAGGVLSYRDQEMRLNRSGVPEQVWMNLDYSPVIGPEGGPIGVISIVVETTGRVLAERQRKRDEARLEAGRRRQRQLFEQAPGFIIITRGPDHVVEFVNTTHRHLFNSTGWVGRPLADAIPSLGWFQLLDGVYASGEAMTLQGQQVSYERLPGLAPEVRFLSFTMAPMHAEDGSIDGVFCEGFDVSAVEAKRRRDEALDRLVARIADIDDPGQLAQTAAAFAATEVGANRAGIGLIDEARRQVQLLPEWTTPGLPAIAGPIAFDQLGDTLARLRCGEVVRVDDAQAVADPPSAWLEALAIRAALTIPVIEKGHLVAILFVNDGAPRHWTEDEIGFLRRLADRSSAALERRRAEMRLRASEARLRFQDRLSRETAGARDAETLLADTTRMLADYLRASVCNYGDMDADGEELTVLGEWKAPDALSLLGRHHLSSFGAAAQLAAGDPLVVSDTASLAPDIAAAYRRINVAAVICMPLVRDGRLTALMAVHDRVARDWTDDEIALVREVTTRSWAHIERVRLALRHDSEPTARSKVTVLARRS